MLELANLLAALIALAAAAAAAFARPEGLVGWCAFAALFAALGAGASLAVDLRLAFAYCAAAVLAALVLLAAVLLRHALNALGARALLNRP